MVGSKDRAVIEVSDFSGGANSIEHPLKYNDNQVSYISKGFFNKKSGITKHPGAIGIKSTAIHNKQIRGIKEYNSDYFIFTDNNGYINNCAKQSGTVTAITSGVSNSANRCGYTICQSYGTFFGEGVKVETYSTGSRIGIVAPTTGSAAAGAGAGLADGSYSIYWSYARKVSGTIVLYSIGKSLGSVTLGSGSNQIALTSLGNSSDPQVNCKVIWIKSPGESIHYYYALIDDNTTTSITITSSSSKNTSLIYEYDAADNGLPPSDICYIYAFADRLWALSLSHPTIIYYSEKGTFSKYDLEKWRSSGYRNIQYNCTGIFSVGQNLYFNTDNGIMVLEFGDTTQQTYLVNNQYHFVNMNTVAEWDRSVIGLTNYGIRIFDGSSFSSFDLAYPIRNALTNIYAQANGRYVYGAERTFPHGFIYRRSNRDEYHLMWCSDEETSISDTTINHFNNKHVSINLSGMSWGNQFEYTLPWEFWNYSGNGSFVDKTTNDLYYMQPTDSASQVYKENTDSNNILYIYTATDNTEDTEYVSTQQTVECKLRSRDIQVSLDTLITLINGRVYVQNDSAFTIRFYDAEKESESSVDFPIPANGGVGVTFGTAIFDSSIFPAEFAGKYKFKFRNNFKCNSFSIEITHSENDTNFKLIKIQTIADIEKGNYL